MSGVVVSLCDRTGNMVRPWLEAGYEAITVDLQAADPEPGRTHLVMSVTDPALPLALMRLLKGRQPAAVFAFPPCTHLAVSGARWFQAKGMGKLIEALQIVEACRKLCEELGAPYMVENPVSTLATYWRKPDHLFDPYEFTGLEPADNYTKRTCLWAGGGFVMPRPRALPMVSLSIQRVVATAGRMLPKRKALELFNEPSDYDLVRDFYPDNRIHDAPPSDERGDIRSATPMGFARAVFAANHTQPMEKAA